MQRKTKYVPRAALGLLQPKAQTRSCCPWKEARASPQFTPPTSQPCSHTLYLTTSNRCVNPSLDLHHPFGRIKPHGFSGVWLKVMHTCKAQWSQGLKSLTVGADPCPFPSGSKGNTETFVVKPFHRRHTEWGLYRQGGKQRWAPRWRGAVLHLPFRWISEALSSFSTACPRHINRESETFLSRGRSSFIALWRRSSNSRLSPIHPPAESLPRPGLAGIQPTRIPRQEPAAAGMSRSGRTQLFLIACLCFHRLRLPWLGTFWGRLLFCLSYFFPKFHF